MKDEKEGKGEEREGKRGGRNISERVKKGRVYDGKGKREARNERLGSHKK